MTDRERLAELLWDRCASMVGLQGMSNWNEIHDRYRGEWREVADAVLAAIGDRLLPEVPEWVSYIQADWHGSHWLAQVSDYPGSVEVERDGDTAYAAIRKALESQPEAAGTYGIPESGVTE